MTEILTESFCERCGTRYTFESSRQRVRLTGVKTLSRGLKNFVLSDDTSLDEAMAAARSESDREATSHQLDAFHKTFSFCMSCRQYTCPNCWNEPEARCLSCAPLALPEPPVAIADLTVLGETGLFGQPTPGNGNAAHDIWPVTNVTAEPPGTAPEPEVMAEQIVDAASEPEVEAIVEAEPEVMVEQIVEASVEVEVQVEELVESAPEVEVEATVAAEPDVAVEQLVEAAPEPEIEAIVEAEPEAVEQIVEAAAEQAVEVEQLVEAAPEAEVEAVVEAEADQVVEAAPEPEAMPVMRDAAGKASAQTVGLLRRFRPGQSLDAELDAYEQTQGESIPTEAGQAEPEPEPVELVEAEDTPEAEAAASLDVAEPTPEAAIEPTPEPEPFPLAAATGSDVVEQPTWRITAPDPTGTTPPTPSPERGGRVPLQASATPAAPADAEPQWPATPQWPSAKAAAGLPGLGRPATPKGGIEALWAASNQELVTAPPAPGRPASGIQPCVSCGLSLSATARFCRRCGTLQAR
jgi:hypothetical protein